MPIWLTPCVIPRFIAIGGLKRTCLNGRKPNSSKAQGDAGPRYSGLGQYASMRVQDAPPGDISNVSYRTAGHRVAPIAIMLLALPGVVQGCSAPTEPPKPPSGGQRIVLNYT